MIKISQCDEETMFNLNEPSRKRVEKETFQDQFELIKLKLKEILPKVLYK